MNIYSHKQLFRSSALAYPYMFDLYDGNMPLVYGLNRVNIFAPAVYCHTFLPRARGNSAATMEIC